MLTSDWLEYGPLMKSDDVCEFLHGRVLYRHGAGPMLWRALTAVGAVNPGASVFLANEAQDGQAWEAQIEGATPNWSAFDMALLPQSSAALYDPVETSFHAARVEGGAMALVRKEYWPRPLW